MTIHDPARGTLPVRGLAALPAADDADVLAAHLMLAILSCHLRLAEEAHLHLAHALTLVSRQAARTQTLRAAAPSMLVRVRTQSQGQAATLALPCVGGKPVAPRIALAAILPALRDKTLQTAMVELCDVDIAIIRLRVRTGRMAARLQRLSGLGCLDKLADSLAVALDESIFPAPAAAPLDMAERYFMLARHFTRSDNAALAGLALQKAKRQMEIYACATDIPPHAARSHDIAARIDRLLEQPQKESLLF